MMRAAVRLSTAGLAPSLSGEPGPTVGAVVSTGAVALMPLFTDVSWSGGLGVATFVYTFLRTIGMHLPERVRAATDTLSYTVMQVALPIIGLALGIALVKQNPTQAAKGITVVLGPDYVR